MNQNEALVIHCNMLYGLTVVASTTGTTHLASLSTTPLLKYFYSHPEPEVSKLNLSSR